MSDKKIDKLVHIQRSAIRNLIFSRFEEREVENRYKRETKKETKDIKEALKRSDKNTLIKIVEISPEITQEDIENCYEEYRYNSRPSFRLFLPS